MIRARCGIAIAVAGLLVTAATAHADVKAQEKTQIRFEGALGKIFNLFGGSRAKEGVVQTVSVKGDRKATMSGDSGTIVDLAEEKVYEVNLKDKSYKVVTFAELRRQMEEARKKAEEDAREAREDKKDPNQKEMEVDFDIKETGLKKDLNGYSCRQVVTTIGVHEKGKKLEQAGGILMTVESWMAPTIAAMKESMAFDMRYAQKMGLDAAARDLAQAMAMYPGLKEAMAKFDREKVNMEGTAVQSVMTFQTVMTPEQAAQAKNRDDEKPSSPVAGLGGMLGRFGRKKPAEDAKDKEPAKTSAAPASPNKSTIMTSTNDLLSVSTAVSASDVEIPAGFKLKK
jgi:hypothetical protein